MLVQNDGLRFVHEQGNKIRHSLFGKIVAVTILILDTRRAAVNLENID
jgi:hypothetical protein